MLMDKKTEEDGDGDGDATDTLHSNKTGTPLTETEELGNGETNTPIAQVEVKVPTSSAPLPERDRLFENFVIVGLGKPTGELKTGAPCEPQIEYRYPEEKILASKRVAQFCFPDQVMPALIRRTPSCSQLHEVLYGQPHLHTSRNTYVFRLTGEDTVMYGLCIIKMEFTQGVAAVLADSASSLDTEGKTQRSSYMAAPKCYCLISKHPFFSLHLDVLLAILAQNRLKHFITEDEQKRAKPDVVELILEEYYDKVVPKAGETLYFQLPEDSRSRTFYCPLGDGEARLIADWALVPTFKILSSEHILLLFAALLLEKPIIIVSSNLSSVSAVVLSIVPLLRPLKWQGLLIPILPSALREVLEAPVPFVTGVSRLDNVSKQVEALIINLDKNTISHYNIPLLAKLPEAKKLLHNIQQYHNVLYKKPEHHNPLTTTPDESKAAQSILDVLHTYSLWLANKIKAYYNSSNLKLDSLRNRELLHKSFVQTVSAANRDFVECFLSTQTFSVYSSQQFGDKMKRG